MSNFRAIATVTAALRDVLMDLVPEVQSAPAGPGIPEIEINIRPPHTIGPIPQNDGLNIFLYQVTPNNGYQNLDLPTRNQFGETIESPQLGLNLHYLLTAYGSQNDELRAHLILASAMRILYENPILTRDRIRNVVAAAGAGTSITGSDLADQVELVKFSQQSLSLEEITKLWSSFFQTSYHISVAYQATVVLLESTIEPKATLPVSERFVYVFPFREPIIDNVEPQILEGIPNAKITIKGRNLKSDELEVQFDDLQPQTPEKITDNEVVVTVPNTLTPGMKSVRIVNKMNVGLPKTSHKGYESNVIAFMLAPHIRETEPPEPSRGSDLIIKFEPPATSRQKVSIIIGDYTFPVRLDSNVEKPINDLTLRIRENFPVKGQSQDYLIRLRIDGAESFLKRSTRTNKFTGPKITIKKNP